MTTRRAGALLCTSEHTPCGPQKALETPLTAEVSISASCTYPDFDFALVQRTTVPPLAWRAMTPEGELIDFQLADVHCNADWKWVKTIHFVFSAGWCSSCTHYKRQLVRRAETLRNLGMLIVVIELQTKTVGQPADTAFAYAHAKALTDPPPWIVAGDLDTVLANSPDEGQGFIRRSGFVTLYPTLIVVRTRDMNLIVDGSPNGSWAGRTLPLEQIARDPEKLWLPGPF